MWVWVFPCPSIFPDTSDPDADRLFCQTCFSFTGDSQGDFGLGPGESTTAADYAPAPEAPPPVVHGEQPVGVHSCSLEPGAVNTH